jgi:hypothetical protein
MAIKQGRLVATTSFAAQVGGELVHVHAGDTVAKSHPVVTKGRAELFRPADAPDHEEVDLRRP